MQEFKFYRLLNKVGYYAKVKLEVSSTDEISLQISYDEYVEAEWIIAIEFAIRFFYEHYRNYKVGGLKVHVHDLHTMIVDTSNVTVFYVVVKCLCNIMNYDADMIMFDEQKGEFCIRK